MAEQVKVKRIFVGRQEAMSIITRLIRYSRPIYHLQAFRKKPCELQEFYGVTGILWSYRNFMELQEFYGVTGILWNLAIH